MKRICDLEFYHAIDKEAFRDQTVWSIELIWMVSWCYTSVDISSSTWGRPKTKRKVWKMKKKVYIFLFNFNYYF